MGFAKEFLPKYTVDDYRLWEGDWELIEGIPYAMSPSPFGIHQRVISELISQILPQIKSCDNHCYVYPELDWIIDENTVLRPDLIVICRDIKEYLKETPEVVVEVVSKSTAQKDEHLKFAIYEKEKVPFYVLVYPDIGKVRVFQLVDRKFDKYFDGEDGILEISLKNGCNFKVDVKKLF